MKILFSRGYGWNFDLIWACPLTSIYYYFFFLFSLSSVIATCFCITSVAFFIFCFYLFLFVSLCQRRWVFRTAGDASIHLTNLKSDLTTVNRAPSLKMNIKLISENQNGGQYNEQLLNTNENNNTNLKRDNKQIAITRPQHQIQIY